jgi:hypothetical protein
VAFHLDLDVATRGGVIHRHRGDDPFDVFVGCIWHRRHPPFPRTPGTALTCPTCVSAVPDAERDQASNHEETQ